MTTTRKAIIDDCRYWRMKDPYCIDNHLLSIEKRIYKTIEKLQWQMSHMEAILKVKANLNAIHEIKKELKGKKNEHNG